MDANDLIGRRAVVVDADLDARGFNEVAHITIGSTQKTARAGCAFRLTCSGEQAGSSSATYGRSSTT